MTLDARRTRRRLFLVLFLTLLPWPAVWLGMYHLKNLFWTFALYHGCCLLPASLWGAKLWRGSLRLPTRAQWAGIVIAMLIAVPSSVAIYTLSGTRLISGSSVLFLIHAEGFHDQWLLPLILYFVPVNAILEEAFWRGVVLNELRGMDEAAWTLGAVWTALTFGAWHYLVLHLLLQHGWAEIGTVGIVAVGVFLSWLYRRTHSIIVPILWHGLVFDLSLLFIFGAIVRAG